MLRVTHQRNIGIVFALVLSCAAYATAQDAASPAVEGKSFYETLKEGAELPGLLIGLMSVAAVALIAEHFITIRGATMAPADEVEKARAMIEGRRYRECVDQLRGSRSMFAHLVTAGLHHSRHGYEAMHEAVEETAEAWASRLFRRAEYLNILGNLGPLMGLLGTVIGMIDAFGRMRASHGAYKTEDLAGGISQALVNTFLGLMLAIVGLGFFGMCRNRVDRWTVEARAAALDLLEYFRPGGTTLSPPSATPPPTSRPM